MNIEQSTLSDSMGARKQCGRGAVKKEERGTEMARGPALLGPLVS